MKKQVTTVNIRVYRDTRDRLKIKAAKKHISIMQYIDALSRLKEVNEAF